MQFLKKQTKRNRPSEIGGFFIINCRLISFLYGFFVVVGLGCGGLLAAGFEAAAFATVPVTTLVTLPTLAALATVVTLSALIATLAASR